MLLLSRSKDHENYHLLIRLKRSWVEHKMSGISEGVCHIMELGGKALRR